MRSGGDNNSCPNCVIEFMGEVMRKLKTIVKSTCKTDDEYILKIKEIHADILTCTVEELEDMHYFADFKF